MKTVTYLKHKPCQRQHQRGAVAIMLGLSLLVLFGFMALVFDLGRTYVVRTELQNAADAAALAGAKDLNQKLSGIANAVTTVNAIGLRNNTKFSFNGDAGIDITPEMIRFSKCPREACDWKKVSEITSANVAEMTFIKVEIPSGDLATFFARIADIAATKTYGLAVAGSYLKEITPIGICAVDPETEGGRRPVGGGLPDELTEFGFRRGIAYDLMQLGPLVANSTPFLLNPVDVYPGPPCDDNHSSADYARSFICTGTSASIESAPSWAFGSTGMSWGPVRDALNSRFDDFSGAGKCDPTSAPPDVNVKEYIVPKAAGVAGPEGNPRDWTQEGFNDYPAQQSISTADHKPVPAPTIGQYGALWSYSRAVQANGTTPPYKAGTAFALDDWENLYGTGLAADTSATGYPGSASIPPFPAGTLAAPYNTSDSSSWEKYFTEPNTSRPGKIDRRVLNVAIVDCVASSGNNCNSKIRIIGVGRFFMQTKAVNPSSIYAEFDGLVNPIPSFEIKLYR